MTEPSRRTVLAAGAAGFVSLAGCTKYGESSNTPATTAPAGAELAKTAAVPVGGGLIIAASQIVVTQPVAGSFKAFSSICTHQACQVATVADGTINCDCHGSKYAVADGSVVGGPAPQPLPAKQIKVSGDSITLA